MLRPSVALLCSALLAGPAFADLEIRDIKPMHGPLGPERASYSLSPGDELFITYVVTGCGTDKEGAANVELRSQLIDADGKPLLDETRPITGVLILAGRTFPGFVNLSVGSGFKPGKYTLKVTLHDKIREESVSFDRKVTVQPPDFAPVRLRFSFDAKGEVPAPAGGVLGQMLFVRASALGFDKSQKKFKVNMKIQLLDEKGRELMSKPLSVDVASEDADKVAAATSLAFNGHLVLNRVGAFTLRLTFTDEIANKSTQVEVPLKVTER